MASLGLVMVMAIGAAPAAAQHRAMKARGYFGFGGGLSVPVGSFGDAYKTGWLVQGLAGITSKGGVVGGRVDASFGQNNRSASGGGRVQLIGANADLVLTPGHRPANFHPYFMAGAGVYNLRPSAGLGSSVTKLALNGGAGVQMHLGHRSDFYVEGRFVTIRNTGGPDNLVPVTVGFRWGGI